MQIAPFADKVLQDGKDIFKREHGVQFVLAVGQNDCIFTVPYNWVKIIGVEIINGQSLDYCDFYILDSITGTYSTIPNYQLNQFGYSVNISSDFFQKVNNYEADLYLGMQIKIVYYSQSIKTIGINYNLNEIK